MKPKTKSILTIGLIVLIIALLAFSVFFGLDLGFARIEPMSEGITLGLDLVGGSEITYEADIPEGMSSDEISDGMEVAQTMLRQRLNALGYTEANVYLYGATRIVVEIPNVSDPEEAVQMLGTTAVIQFRDYQDNVILEGTDIESAKAQYGQISENAAAQYFVSLKLSEAGYEKFVKATSEIAGYTDGNNYLSIVMDDEVISQPGVGAEYAGVGLDTDTPIITLGNNASGDYASYLAQIISAGQMPFALHEAKLEAVGASLGERSLETAILAGIIGVILVMIFMVVVYRLPGIVADFALLLYIVLFMVVMSAVHLNLSLPGIAGIILTIGMAVDANIVIYERIKEEIRSGKTVRSSIDAGFKRAFSAILDSNITTLIAAFVLIWQGTGTILGFAKTLLIGVILSMVCMLIVPRLILKRFADMRIVKPSLYGVKGEIGADLPEKKAFNFTGKFKITGLISILLCLTAIVGLVLLPLGTTLFNLDLDFVGGVTMEYDINQPVTQDISNEVSSIVRDVTGISPSSVTKAGDAGTTVTIKMSEISSEQRESVFNALGEKYGTENVTLISSDYVSASVGKDIARAAIVASLVAALLILVYITVRFELRSGFSAIVCLIHDLLVMLSVYIIFQIPMNMNFIAAALTIIGYSINATIVIFDRVRENYKKTGGQQNFAVVVNNSVTQTLARSVGTTITTLLPVIMIIILGVSSIRNFAIPIAVGVISGGYSSVFIAAPLWNKLKGKKGTVKVK